MITAQKNPPLCDPQVAADTLEKPSPFILEFFMVQGMGFRCMAYRDQNGKWRSAFAHRELPGNVYILE